MPDYATPWRDMEEAAEFLRCKDKHGAWSARNAIRLLDRAKVPTRKIGREVRVHIDDLNAALKVRQV